MLKSKIVSRCWFIGGLLSAATLGAFASLPGSSGTVAPTDDVSEIRAQRHADLSFDQDVKNLAAIQGRYHENLPLSKRKAFKTAAVVTKKRPNRKVKGRKTVVRVRRG